MADLNLQVKVLKADAEEQLSKIISELEKKKINLKLNIKDTQLKKLGDDLERVYKNAKKASDALSKPGGNSNSAFEASKNMLNKLRAEEAKLSEMYDVGKGKLHHSQTKVIENQLQVVREEIAKNEKAMNKYANMSGDLSKKVAKNHADMMASSQAAVNKSLVIDNKYSGKISDIKDSIKENEAATKAAEDLKKTHEDLDKSLTASQSSLISKHKTVSTAFKKNNDIQRQSFKDLKAEFDSYQQNYEKYLARSNELDAKVRNKTITDGEIDEAKNLKTSMNQMVLDMDNIQKRMDAMVAPVRQAENAALAYDKLGSRLTDYYNKYGNQLRKNIDLHSQWEKLLNRTNKHDFSSISEANREFAAFRTQCRAANIEVETFGSKLEKAFGSRLRGQLSYYGFVAMETALRDILQNAVAVDTAMTELKKVTSETDTVYTQFLEGAEQRAQRLGATLSEVVNATADYARLGYNIDQATTLADSALIYSNVGDDVQGIDDATGALISTMQGFNIAAEDSMSIVDKFNNVSNNYASSAGDIGEIVRRSAASMSAAGNSLDQTNKVVWIYGDIYCKTHLIAG